MKKSGLADSPFFAAPEPKADVINPLSPSSPEKPTVQIKRVINKRKIVNTLPAVQPEPQNKDEMNKSMHASNNASMHASNQPLIHETIIETIRKAVKDVGKDSATYRFTPEEKKALLELSFSYKMQGYKTSENELTRIAINFLLEDHRQNGKNSVLQRVLDALNK
jgi:hypothetical protein